MRKGTGLSRETTHQLTTPHLSLLGTCTHPESSSLTQQPDWFRSLFLSRSIASNSCLSLRIHGPDKKRHITYNACSECRSSECAKGERYISATKPQGGEWACHYTNHNMVNGIVLRTLIEVMDIILHVYNARKSHFAVYIVAYPLHYLRADPYTLATIYSSIYSCYYI